MGLGTNIIKLRTKYSGAEEYVYIGVKDIFSVRVGSNDECDITLNSGTVVSVQESGKHIMRTYEKCMEANGISVIHQSEPPQSEEWRSQKREQYDKFLKLTKKEEEK